MNQATDGQVNKEKWSSATVFMMATVGAAVGLGNLWRFPFVTGQNGGAAFVLVYIGFVLLLGLPLMMAELAMGRRGGGSPVASMRKLARDMGASGFWSIIGWISILVPLIGMSYYSVVAGWSIDYVFKAGVNAFDGLTGEESGNVFNRILASPGRLLFFHGLFIAAGVFVVARGVGKGIEAVSKYMIPALFVILVVLVINSIFNADIERGLDFLFNPDFSKITPNVAFMALGQAFFSLAIGVGVMLTYGAYVPAQISLPKAAFMIAIADSVVAILAGVAIFPVVFASGLDPAEGPGLLFVTLPVAFGNMQAGHLVGLLFFILLFFAAYSSILGMLEPVVSYLEDHRGFSRPKVTVLTGLFSWLLGVAAALSFNVWSDVRLLGAIPYFADKSIFDLLDFLIANFLIPLNALLIAVFSGWVLTRQALLDELGVSSVALSRFLQIVLRFVAPVLIGAIFYNSVT
ncbi:MAG: sodium-dependent transporter [Woeseiaceae bacterium]|nr:sodium-dependent transporter [Woeseiaceae bacterium]